MSERTSCLFGNRGNEKRAFIEITDLCNMRCKHCMNESGENNFKGLKKEDLFSLFDELISCNFKHLYVSGGEPLMYHAIDEVLEYAHELGMKITLATNGWYIRQHLEIIKKCIEVVSVSMDGIGTTHDKIRGISGSYDKTIQNLKALSDIGVTTKISSMIWKENIDQLEEIVVKAKSNGVSKVNFAILVPVGRADVNRDILVNKKLYTKIFKEIEQLSKKYQNDITVEIKRQQGVSQECLACPGGDFILHIDAFGKISPCSWLAKSDFHEFNTMWKPGILNECLVNFDNFKKLLKKREKEFKYTGCPAMAYIYHGDYLAKDPINELINV